MRIFIFVLFVVIIGFGVYKVVTRFGNKSAVNTQNMYQVDDSYLKEKAKQYNTRREDDTYQKEMARLGMLGVPEGAIKYEVDPKASKIEWASEKKLIDWKHNGTVQIESGSLYKSTGKDGVEIVMGYVAVDMDTMTNLDHGGANETLIKHLKSSDFFDVKTYPVAIVKFSATPDPTAAVKNGSPWKATGTLTIRGKTNPVDFTVVSEESADGLVIGTSSLVIDRSKYDVKFGSESFFQGLGDNIIKDEIPLTITLTAKRS